MQVELTSKELHDGLQCLLVIATVVDGNNVRSGPHYVQLPEDAGDEDIKEYIASLY
jgi:hypothetical protein